MLNSDSFDNEEEIVGKSPEKSTAVEKDSNVEEIGHSTENTNPQKKDGKGFKLGLLAVLVAGAGYFGYEYLGQQTSVVEQTVSKSEMQDQIASKTDEKVVEEMKQDLQKETEKETTTFKEVSNSEFKFADSDSKETVPMETSAQDQKAVETEVKTEPAQEVQEQTSETQVVEAPVQAQEPDQKQDQFAQEMANKTEPTETQVKTETAVEPAQPQQEQVPVQPQPASIETVKLQEDLTKLDQLVRTAFPVIGKEIVTLKDRVTVIENNQANFVTKEDLEKVDLTNKVTDLETRVAELEKQKDQYVTKQDLAQSKVKHVEKKAFVKKEKAVKNVKAVSKVKATKPKSENFIEISNAKPKVAIQKGYKIRSILNGIVWVEDTSGHSRTYKIGDQIGSKTIGAIDVMSGVYDTNGFRIIGL